MSLTIMMWTSVTVHIMPLYIMHNYMHSVCTNHQSMRHHIL